MSDKISGNRCGSLQQAYFYSLLKKQAKSVVIVDFRGANKSVQEERRGGGRGGRFR